MTVKDILLFATENGEVYQCGFFKRLVLTFKGYWVVFDGEGFVRFRNQVVRLAMCPVGRRMFASEGLRLIGDNDGTVLRLRQPEVEELVWLLDSAQYVLLERRSERVEADAASSVEVGLQFS